MQNADPRLNVSQQQPTISIGQLNSLGLNAQNNGVMQVPPGQMVVNAVPGVIGGVAQGMRGLPPPPPPPGGPPVVWPAAQHDLVSLENQRKELEKQVVQSEQNLAAQHAALMTEQQHRVKEAVRIAQETVLRTNAQTTNTDLEKFDLLLKPIIDNCTKDGINAGKRWIIDFSITKASNQVVCDYLLQR